MAEPLSAEDEAFCEWLAQVPQQQLDSYCFSSWRPVWKAGFTPQEAASEDPAVIERINARLEALDG